MFVTAALTMGIIGNLELATNRVEQSLFQSIARCEDLRVESMYTSNIAIIYAVQRQAQRHWDEQVGTHINGRQMISIPMHTGLK